MTREEEIERFEKYREGYAWIADAATYSLGQVIVPYMMEQFAYFYAHSDWDDPAAAYREWWAAQ